MAKLKKTAKTSARKSSTARKAQPERISKSITESAQQIWLAGMGAFNRAQSEGSKLFEGLVRDGLSLEQAVQSLGHVAEGVYTARTALARARHAGVEMPLAETVVDLLDGRLQAEAAVRHLMERDPRQE